MAGTVVGRNEATGSAILLFVIVSGVFGISFAGAKRVGAARAAIEETAYRPAQALRPGEELVLVYLGSSSCTWSRSENLPRLVATAKGLVAARARRLGWSFRAIGIAADWDEQAGLRHLQRFGRFDEIAAGGNWGNSLLQRYYDRLVVAPAGVPQLIVIRRHNEEPDFSTGHFANESQLERLVTRADGLREIQRWVRAGGPLPGIPASADQSDSALVRPRR